MSISTGAAVIHEPKGEFERQTIRLADLHPDNAALAASDSGEVVKPVLLMT